MITFSEASAILRKQLDCAPTIYKEYKDRYRFVFIPESYDTDDPFCWVTNVDVDKRTGEVKYPSLFDAVGKEMDPIRTGIYVK